MFVLGEAATTAAARESCESCALVHVREELRGTCSLIRINCNTSIVTYSMLPHMHVCDISIYRVVGKDQF